MLGYIIRRVLWIIPVLFVVSVITFTLMHAAPGGPWSREKKLPASTVERLNDIYGLNDPIPVQYLRWVGGLLHADLGPSYKFRDRSVNDIVAAGIGTTVQLGIQAFLLSVIVGIPLGVIAALRHNGWPDYVATFISVLGICTPSFVAAILLLVIFSVLLKWFPTFGWDDPSRWVLPTVALALLPIAQIARYTRASMLEVTRKDYVRTAQSKGLKERTVVVVHMIRNALHPGDHHPRAAPGLPHHRVASSSRRSSRSRGVGKYYVDSIGQRDYGVIMAMTMLYAAAIAVLNLVVDVLYAYIDPRIRYS